jgi:hypothetical protein
MRGEHKFVRTRGGILGFALVTLESEPSVTWQVVWHDEQELTALRAPFESAVDSGIKIAAAAHELRGGAPQRVEILAIGHNPADTRPDAVTCAAAIAAWKSWGQDPAQAQVEYLDGWTVAFGPDSPV